MFSTEGSDFFKAAMKGIRPESYLGHFRTRGPWALKLCLRTNLAIDQSSRSYTYTLFYYPRGWGAKLSLSSLYGQRFYEIRAESLSYWLIFKITIFGHETWPKLRKLNIYSLSIPGGWNWAYFCSTGSRFRDIGRFSKLPYLGMKLGHWPKLRKLHIYTLSTPLSPKFHSVLLYSRPFPT